MIKDHAVAATNLKLFTIVLLKVTNTLVGIHLSRNNFKQCGILTSVDSDEPVQPPLKLRNSKWFSDSRLTLKQYSND